MRLERLVMLLGNLHDVKDDSGNLKDIMYLFNELVTREDEGLLFGLFFVC